MRFPDYLKLLSENRFRIHPTRWPLTFLAGSCTVANWMLAGIQRVIYGNRIRETTVTEPPIFIIGHWRSGTTLMHELMSLHPRYGFPTNYDAFVPHHMFVSRYFVYPLINLLLPRKRPMDNMRLGAGAPQEDDFALCGLGAPTPYRRIAFPNRSGCDHIPLNLSRASAEQVQSLKDALVYFYKSLTLKYGKRLVLKSPPHTGRVRALAEWFPGAKFIHLSRHPYRLVPSTMHLWRSLDHVQAFQMIRYDDVWLKNYVFECQDLMYQSYFDDIQTIPSNQLAEVRFEDLIQDPVGEIRRVYDQLELEHMDELLPLVEQSLTRRRNHKQNELTIDDHLRIEIDQHWHGYMEQFGYLNKEVSGGAFS